MATSNNFNKQANRIAEPKNATFKDIQKLVYNGKVHFDSIESMEKSLEKSEFPMPENFEKEAIDLFNRWKKGYEDKVQNHSNFLKNHIENQENIKDNLVVEYSEKEHLLKVFKKHKEDLTDELSKQKISVKINGHGYHVNSADVEKELEEADDNIPDGNLKWLESDAETDARKLKESYEIELQKAIKNDERFHLYNEKIREIKEFLNVSLNERKEELNNEVKSAKDALDRVNIFMLTEAIKIPEKENINLDPVLNINTLAPSRI